MLRTAAVPALGPVVLVVLVALVATASSACRALPPGDGPHELPLVLTLDDGVADSQVVPVEVEGVRGWLALDTGSARSFLFLSDGEPPFVEDAGEARLGGRVVRLSGRALEGLPPETFRGEPILGLLGLDFFLPRGEIDYPGARVVAYGARRPDGAGALPALPLRVVDGLARVTVRIDGRERHLMLDTGAHDTLLLGERGRPGDLEIGLRTADGAVTAAFAGTATIELPGEPPRAVPVWRAPSVDYLDWLVAEQDAEGLLGLTSLGARRLVFDGELLRLGPRR